MPCKHFKHFTHDGIKAECLGQDFVEVEGGYKVSESQEGFVSYANMAAYNSELDEEKLKLDPAVIALKISAINENILSIPDVPDEKLEAPDFP